MVTKRFTNVTSTSPIEVLTISQLASSFLGCHMQVVIIQRQVSDEPMGCVCVWGRGGEGIRGGAAGFPLLASISWCFFKCKISHNITIFSPAPPPLPFGIILSGGPSL